MIPQKQLFGQQGDHIESIFKAAEYSQCAGFTDMLNTALIAQQTPDETMQVYSSANPSIIFNKWTVYEDEVIS